ncbi:hypothetical protein ABVN80_09380 [Acinetobacter baumannii]
MVSIQAEFDAFKNDVAAICKARIAELDAGKAAEKSSNGYGDK